METRLQSNEIRIPKPEFGVKSSNSQTGSDGLNTSGSSSSSNCHHYFKSSFARSLSTFGSSPQSKSLSLDFAINYGNSGEDYHNSHFSPLSMPPMYSHSHLDQQRFCEEEGDGGKLVTDHSCESLVSSSSLATVRNVDVDVDVWTGNTNAQVCLLCGLLFCLELYRKLLGETVKWLIINSRRVARCRQTRNGTAVVLKVKIDSTSSCSRSDSSLPFCLSLVADKVQQPQ